MGVPAPVPAWTVYLGDPFTAVLTFSNMDLRGFTYVAQIRATAADPGVLTTFTLNFSYVSPNSIIELSLAGDNAGVNDSITRRLGRSAVWDLQQYNLDGTTSQTLLVGSLAMTQDITRQAAG